MLRALMRAARIPSEMGTLSSSHRSARLARYLLERFPIPTYGPLIVALVACGRAAGSIAMGGRPELNWAAAATTVSVAAAFLQLRLLDDIRDEAADRAGRPGRPLPRGLVTVGELRSFAAMAAAVGLVFALAFGAAGTASYVLALAAIWFCGLDLPRRLPIRHDLLTTALVHSVIAPLVLLFTWTTVAGLLASGPLVATLVLVWGASLGMEIARKTVAPSDERPGVETYSADLGHPRAVLLAALALSVACLGAAAYAVTVGAPKWLAFLPLVAAVTIPPLARQVGERIGTVAVRSAAATIVLGVLLWPLVLALVSP